jgi:hypothetical protein
LNMYLNARVHDSILTKDKNSTSKGSREDRKVTVSEPPKMLELGLLHLARMTTSLTGFNIFMDIPNVL